MGAVVLPQLGEKMIVDQIDDDSGKAPSLRSHQRFQAFGQRMFVGEAVDGAMTDDALHHTEWKLDRPGSPGHEVSEQIADSRQCLVFSQKKMGQVIQSGASLESRKLDPAMRAFRYPAGWRKIAAVRWIWCNGDFHDGPLAVSPADRGLTHGLGLFETVLAVDGEPVALDLHLARMKEGAGRLGWALGDEDFGEVIPELLHRKGLEKGRARVRIAMTAGAGELHDPGRGMDALLWITASASLPPPAAVSLATAAFARNERSPLAGLKCASYAENVLALAQARRAGADEPLFFNTRSELCEAATANVFLVKDGVIFTPPLESGCLPGTMRQRVMARAAVTECVLTERDVVEADEVFLTSAIRGVVPVARIDGRELALGPVSGRLA